jgi:hypothetical protein
MDNEKGWRPIKYAPFQTVIEVRNPQMDKPCLATRGHATPAGVCADTTFCTTVFTPDPLFPRPAGRLCCPTEWRHPARKPTRED